MSTEFRIPGLDLDSDFAVNLDGFTRTLASENKRSATIRTYTQSVEAFDAYLTEKGMPRRVADIRREHVEDFLNHLARRYSQHTVVNRRGGLRSFFNWCISEGEMKESPMRNMKSFRVDEVVKPTYTHEQLTALINSVKRSDYFLGRRDYAMMLLLASTGMRLSEIANLVTDGVSYDRIMDTHPNENGTPSGFVDWEENSIELRRTKGRKVRSLYLHPPVRKALLRYMQSRQSHSKAALPWLWLGVSGRVKRAPVGRFGVFGVGQMIKRRCEEAGLPYLPPHNWRHTYIVRNREAGMSDAALIVNAGWSAKTGHQMLARYSKYEETELAKKEEAERGYGSLLG